jgi:hypothetical protein
VRKGQLANVAEKTRHGPPSRAAGRLGPDWHYHTGHVFVHVISGEFVADVDPQGRKRFGAGQVYHEAVNTTMQARNGSATQSTDAQLAEAPLAIIAPVALAQRGPATDLMHRTGGTKGKTCPPRSQWPRPRATACKAPRQRRHSRQAWECGICNLQF